MKVARSLSWVSRSKRRGGIQTVASSFGRGRPAWKVRLRLCRSRLLGVWQLEGYRISGGLCRKNEGLGREYRRAIEAPRISIWSIYILQPNHNCTPNLHKFRWERTHPQSASTPCRFVHRSLRQALQTIHQTCPRTPWPFPQPQRRIP